MPLAQQLLLVPPLLEHKLLQVNLLLEKHWPAVLHGVQLKL